MLADIKNNPPTLQRPICTMRTLIADLPNDDERSALSDMLADKRWTGADIARALTAETGAAIQAHTVLRHRKGECDCGRESK